MRANPYLFFNGNCEEAFKFYEKVLGGKITAMMPATGTPAEDQVPADWKDKIMHAALDIGEDTLMASDAPPPYQDQMKGFRVSLHFADAAEAERVFNAFAEGGSVTMPLEKTFWAERFGMVHDRFGTPWMINCDMPTA